MRASTLRERIAIEAPPVGSDDEGNPLAEWTEVCTGLPASIRLPGGLESIRASAVVSTVRVSIRVRFRRDLNAGMRVIHGADTYNIQAVLPDLERRRHVDLLCEVIQ